MRDKKDFFNWLYGCKIYHSTTRYGQFNGNHVFATSYNENNNLKELLDNLESYDAEALDAASKLVDLINKREIWLAYDDDPRIAMIKLIEDIEIYYFSILNKEEK